MAQAANAEKTGAVKTQTVSTDRGMFKELSILQSRNMDIIASMSLRVVSRLRIQFIIL